LASWLHGETKVVHDIILSLPHEWVLSNIELIAEPYLQKGSDEEYRAFLYLYMQIDKDLTKRLASRAAIDSDFEIREAGIEYLEKLKQ
jgi:hypothetical protein